MTVTYEGWNGSVMACGNCACTQWQLIFKADKKGFLASCVHCGLTVQYRTLKPLTPEMVKVVVKELVK